MAAVLSVLAVMFLLVGLESAGGGGLRLLGAGEIPDDDGLGARVHATIDGGLASTYVESYTDMDADGTQDDDEVGESWAYWMVDPATRSGVTVLSLGSPLEVFQGTYSGIVREDPEYIAADVPFLGEELRWAGVTLDFNHYIDATETGTGVAHALGDALPAVGTAVTVSGSRSVTYVVDCSVDVDADGTCDDDEVDRYDLAIFDVEAGTAVLVVTDEDPEFLPISLTGLLRRDASAVTEAAAAPEFALEDYDIAVSPTYVLEVGERPTDPALAFGLAGAAIFAALVIGLGLAGGYVGYRRTGSRPAGASSLGVEDAIPVRVTGVLRSPAGGTHVRDTPAILRRFALRTPGPTPVIEPGPAADAAVDRPDAPGSPTLAFEAAPVADERVVQPGETAPPDEWTGQAVEPAPPADAPAQPGEPEIPIDSTVIVERPGRQEGVALGLGELRRLSLGTATTFRGHAPAIAATAGTGRLILAFETVDARDRAAAELVAEAGLDLATVPSAHDGSTTQEDR